MDTRIKNLKTNKKKKKKAEKKTCLQRIDALSEEQKKSMSVVFCVCNPNWERWQGKEYSCCPGYTLAESLSFWPPLCPDDKTRE